MPGLYLAGGSAHPGPGVPMAALSGRTGGGAACWRTSLRPAGRRPGGYAWWYVDALSDDGRHGLTVIAFVGSVFSPYYALARRRGAGDPLDHCAVNVALYGRGASRWAMTERGRARLQRDRPTRSRSGRARSRGTATALTIRLDEVAVPLPSRVRGTVRLHPAGLTRPRLRARRRRPAPLVADRAALAASRSTLERPGPALERRRLPRQQLAATSRWRTPSPPGTGRAPRCADGAAILYEASRRVGGRRLIAIRCDPSGDVEDVAPPPRLALPPTLWRVPRGTRADDGRASVARTLTDAPFYARSVLATRLLGEPAAAVHESLSLDRFRAPWVQAMLPFRMPRALR